MKRAQLADTCSTSLPVSRKLLQLEKDSSVSPNHVRGPPAWAGWGCRVGTVGTRKPPYYVVPLVPCGTVGTMSRVQVEAFKCDVCGHVWLSSSVPGRCARCKSRAWDDGRAQVEDTCSIADRRQKKEARRAALRRDVVKALPSSPALRSVIATPPGAAHHPACRCLRCRPVPAPAPASHPPSPAGFRRTTPRPRRPARSPRLP